MADLATDPNALLAGIQSLAAYAAPAAGHASRMAANAVRDGANAMIVSKEQLHFCLYAGVGLGFLVEAWHDWRHHANHGAREKGLAGLVHWLSAILGL